MFEVVGPPIWSLDRIDGAIEVTFRPFLFSAPFGRPALFLNGMDPSSRSDCSSPMGAMLKEGATSLSFRGLPRGFGWGKILSLSSSSKKSWFSYRSSSAGDTCSRILATGTSSASGVITPSI